MAPVPAGKETKFVYNALGDHQLTWSGSATKTFHTCPPKRVLMVGDSLAFTLGVPWLTNEERYGMQLANAAVLGCAFTTQGELDVDGTWEAQSTGCATAPEDWAKEASAMHAQMVVVELGYRDQFNWKINGHVVHLGPAGVRRVRPEPDRPVRDADGGRRPEGPVPLDSVHEPAQSARRLAGAGRLDRRGTR